ncbi:hypothetical protein [Thermodesulfatator autotrophicus]|uniref:CopG-like ribbon-helix-helix domain-containing protein n=1 Tax=Thermodesulfatator autotrophicus TaxID=1795632 RepID=A0A177E8B6_9BACT|nr:hypothetical protein [Thermodesulfatator autotrophicus]OAG28028.1 hypothetical protein TH606_03635 [Thermodesulfatator autotrophicus]
MPTKNPRLCIVLEEDVYQRIKKLAQVKGMSMSAVVGELINKALDLEEDLLLLKYLSQREEKDIILDEKEEVSQVEYEKQKL